MSAVARAAAFLGALGLAGCLSAPAARPDGGAGGGDAGPSGCSTTCGPILSDDFDGPALTDSWATFVAITDEGSVDVDGTGDVELVSQPQTDYQYVELQSDGCADLAGASLVVDLLVETSGGDGDVMVGFDTDQSWAGVRIWGDGKVTGGTGDYDVDADQTYCPGVECPVYDSAVHRYVSVTSDGTTISFATSADNSAWNPLGTASKPLGPVRVLLWAEGPIGTTQRAVVNSVNWAHTCTGG